MLRLHHIVILLTAAYADCSFAADPPVVNIPSPTFGLDESDKIMASILDAGAALRYYVNNQHPLADDNGNQFGTIDLPRKTIPSGEMRAGTIVTIGGGPYEGPEIRWHATGTLDTPVLIRSPTNSVLPVIRQKILLSGHYAIVEGLQFDQSRTSIRIEPGSSYIAIRANRFIGPRKFAGNTSVLGVQGTATATTSNIVFAGNEIRDFGDTQPESKENDYHGIKASRYCSNIWIVGNRISNMGGDSVQIGDAKLQDAQRCSRIFITENDFFGNRENAIDIKRANGVIVAENDIHDFLPPVSINAPTIVVHDGAAAVWILANQISNARGGVFNTFGTDTWIIGNKINHMWPTPDSDSEDLYGDGTAVHLRGRSSGGILLNVFSDYRHGVQISGGIEYLISGNLFAGATGSAGYDLMIKSPSLLESSVLSQNLHKEFAARVGSSRMARKAQLVDSSARDTQRMGKLLRATLCQDKSLTLGELDTPAAEYAINRFVEYFGLTSGIQTIPMPLGANELTLWCDSR